VSGRFGPCWKPRAFCPRLPALVLRPQDARSGLKDDVFERFAARETIEIGGHHAPAPVATATSITIQAAVRVFRARLLVPARS